MGFPGVLGAIWSWTGALWAGPPLGWKGRHNAPGDSVEQALSSSPHLALFIPASGEPAAQTIDTYVRGSPSYVGVSPSRTDPGAPGMPETAESRHPTAWPEG